MVRSNIPGMQRLVLRRYQGSIYVKMAGAGHVRLLHGALDSQQRVTVGHDLINIYVVSED